MMASGGVVLAAAAVAALGGSGAGLASQPVVIEENAGTDYDCCNLFCDSAAAPGCTSSRPPPIGWRRRFPGGLPGRPDTVPAANTTECIEICSSLYHSHGCKAAAFNSDAKQCFLKNGRANPQHRFGDTSFLLGIGPTSAQIAPGIAQPYVNLGGVTGDHASNWSDFLASGGRGIDTALTYGDDVQRKVAAAIKASGVPRGQIFLATKVPCCPNALDVKPTSSPRGAHCSTSEFNGTITEDISRNLDILGPVPPDLTLLHWPCDTVEQTLVAWRGLEAALAAGHTRSIGVSNFNSSLLAALLPHMKVKPAVNQCGHSIGHHTWNQTAGSSRAGYTGGDDSTVAFCAAHGIQYSAYSPLGGLSGLDVFKNPAVVAIGKRHNVSAAQVALRFLVQRNITIVTAADNAEYISEDMDLLSWGELSKSEMATLAAV